MGCIVVCGNALFLFIGVVSIECIGKMLCCVVAGFFFNYFFIVMEFEYHVF